VKGLIDSYRTRRVGDAVAAIISKTMHIPTSSSSADAHGKERFKMSLLICRTLGEKSQPFPNPNAKRSYDAREEMWKITLAASASYSGGCVLD